MPDPTTPAPDDMPARLAHLRALVEKERRAVSIVVDRELLAELFRQRAALATELEAARVRCESLCTRVAAQSELLTRRAERLQ